MSDINGAGNLMQDERESSDVSFDIFSAPQIEVDMVSSKTIKVKPIAGGNTSQGPVEFLVSRIYICEFGIEHSYKNVIYC